MIQGVQHIRLEFEIQTFLDSEALSKREVEIPRSRPSNRRGVDIPAPECPSGSSWYRQTLESCCIQVTNISKAAALFDNGIVTVNHVRPAARLADSQWQSSSRSPNS